MKMTTTSLSRVEDKVFGSMTTHQAKALEEETLGTVKTRTESHSQTLVKAKVVQVATEV